MSEINSFSAERDRMTHMIIKPITKNEELLINYILHKRMIN